MPDVDRCSREAELGLVDRTLEHASNIAMLDDAVRLTFFRGKSAKQIYEDLIRLRSEVVSAIKKAFNVNNGGDIQIRNSIDNNKIGADLICVLPDNHNNYITLNQ